MSSGRIPSVEGGIQPTILDAKGDLIVATAADTPARLAVGSANQVLTVDSSTATGLKWATPASGGKVLQVVSSSITSYVKIQTTTFTDTNITASITPSSTNSKIYVLVHCHIRVYRDTGYAAGCGARLMRGASEIMNLGDASTGNRFFEVPASSGDTAFANLPILYVDSPSTTSSTTYKVQSRVATTNNGSYVEWQLSSLPSTITLLEIGA